MKLIDVTQRAAKYKSYRIPSKRKRTRAKIGQYEIGWMMAATMANLRTSQSETLG